MAPKKETDVPGHLLLVSNWNMQLKLQVGEFVLWKCYVLFGKTLYLGKIGSSPEVGTRRLWFHYFIFALALTTLHVNLKLHYAVKMLYVLLLFQKWDTRFILIHLDDAKFWWSNFIFLCFAFINLVFLFNQSDCLNKRLCYFIWEQYSNACDFFIYFLLTVQVWGAGLMLGFGRQLLMLLLFFSYAKLPFSDSCKKCLILRKSDTGWFGYF